MDAERVLQNLGHALDKGRARIGASSCTFYVRDKFWRDEFRLAAASGIRYHEPMHGMLYPVSSRHRVVDGAMELYTEDYASAANGSSDGEWRRIDEIPAAARHLFADFIRREHVAASARLMYQTPGGDIDAVLFANYSTKTGFHQNPKLKARLQSVLSSLATNLTSVREAINVTDIRWLSEAARVVSPPLSVVHVDFTSYAPENYFALVLESTLAALDVKDGFGMLHLYNAEEDSLTLSACHGDVENVDRARSHSVARGEGVVSWVVHRRRALLIPDLAMSDYGKYVHRRIKDATQSELAFPIIAGGELIGVMCLESARPNAFVPHHVRSVWYAANRCAIFYQLHRQARMTSELLELCSEATTGDIPGRKALERLAVVAKDYLGGSFSDISCFDHDTGEFILWASSYGSETSHTRDVGWTRYCRRMKVPIWITHTTSGKDYSVREWRGDQWENVTADDLPLPPGVNPASTAQGVSCELGLPIIVRGECVGVAWVKYKRERLEPPQAGLMSLALGFASHAALVVDSLRHIEDIRSLALVASVATDIREEMKGRWAEHHSPVVDLEVISVAYHSDQGGDMYARKRIDSSTVGVLLLDGQGHAVPGLLHMLPFVSAFEACWNSYAPAHVMSQLRAAAKTAGVRANAVYWIVTQIEERRWLLVASAGNVFLIHLWFVTDKGWDFKQLPRDGGPELGGLVSQPQLDQRVDLHAGDVIVAITDGVAQQEHVPLVARIARDLMDRDRNRSTLEIAQILLDRMRDHHGGAWDDDATVIVGRVN